jgi:hypothetical protein
VGDGVSLFLPAQVREKVDLVVVVAPVASAASWDATEGYNTVLAGAASDPSWNYVCRVDGAVLVSFLAAEEAGAVLDLRSLLFRSLENRAAYPTAFRPPGSRLAPSTCGRARGAKRGALHATALS